MGCPMRVEGTFALENMWQRDSLHAHREVAWKLMSENFLEISGLSLARQLFIHQHVVQLCSIWAILDAYPTISAFVTNPLESSAKCPWTPWTC